MLWPLMAAIYSVFTLCRPMRCQEHLTGRHCLSPDKLKAIHCDHRISESASVTKASTVLSSMFLWLVWVNVQPACALNSIIFSGVIPCESGKILTLWRNTQLQHQGQGKQATGEGSNLDWACHFLLLRSCLASQPVSQICSSKKFRQSEIKLFTTYTVLRTRRVNILFVIQPKHWDKKTHIIHHWKKQKQISKRGCSNWQKLHAVIPHSTILQ
jgi:hypothetical protein